MFNLIEINLDDLKSRNWEDTLNEITDRTCNSYTFAFSKAAKEAEENAEDKDHQIFILFQGFTSLMLREADKDHPFIPSVILANGSRSAMITDFSERQLDLFKEWLPLCIDSELKSRIADVIWTRKRQGNHLVAEIAIEAYLESAKILFESKYPHQGVERISRAFYLSVSLGRSSKWFSKILMEVDFLIEKYSKQNLNFVGDLINLTLDYRHDGFEGLVGTLDSLVNYFQQQKNWFVARDMLELKAKIYRKMKEVEQNFSTLERISDLYVQEADEVLQSGRGHMLAAHHIQSAIEALRKVPNTHNKQQELHKVLLDYQQKSLSEFKRVSAEMDLTEPVEIAIEKVKDKPFLEALIVFSMLSSPSKKSVIEKHVEELITQAPLYSLIGSTQIDSKGRVIAQKPSMLSDNPDVVAQAKMAEMYSWAMREQQASGMILHAVRLYILMEHNPTLEDMMQLVIHNPFVPSGRERIFARGYLYGFQGDYLAALHFLVPQLENSIRYVLNNTGVVTSGLNSDGIQEEYDLGRLLDMPDLINIFGEDLVFHLKGIFVERFGLNFRNLYAHGLLDENDFQSSNAVYIWCVMLRLCCLPIISRMNENTNKTQ